MNYTFNILIQNKERRFNQARMLHSMAAILIIIYALCGFFLEPKSFVQFFTGFPVGLIILILSIIKSSLLKKANTIKLLRIVEASFLVLASIYFFKNHQYFSMVLFGFTALLILLTMQMEMQLFLGYTINITDAGIERIMGKTVKKHNWQDIENVIVKGGFLTIDFKNNLLLQSIYTNKLTASEIENFNKDVKERC
jgi:hypothetical protein